MNLNFCNTICQPLVFLKNFLLFHKTSPLMIIFFCRGDAVGTGKEEVVAMVVLGGVFCSCGDKGEKNVAGRHDEAKCKC